MRKKTLDHNSNAFYKRGFVEHFQGNDDDTSTPVIDQRHHIFQQTLL